MRKITRRTEGILFYDINDCRSEDLARAEASLILAGVRYVVRCVAEVNCEQGIAFNFDKRRASGGYSLSGPVEIKSYCNQLKRVT